MSSNPHADLIDALTEYCAAHDELARACKTWAAEAVISVIGGIGAETRREGIAAFVARVDAEQRQAKACDRFDATRLAVALEQLAETEPTP